MTSGLMEHMKCTLLQALTGCRAVGKILLVSGGITGGLELARLGTAGELGGGLLPSDLALVQLKPLRPFAAGEMCAHMAGMSPAVAAARAAQQRARKGAHFRCLDHASTVGRTKYVR